MSVGKNPQIFQDSSSLRPSILGHGLNDVVEVRCGGLSIFATQ
jgi:hypothetical protein